VTRKAWCGLLAAAAALGARAAAPASADPLALEVTGTVPFTPAQLEAALALRARLATPETSRRVVASVTGGGARVRIEVAGRERVIEIDAEDGAGAARLVAFAILDLAGDELDPPPGAAVAVAGTAAGRGTGAGAAAAPAAAPATAATNVAAVDELHAEIDDEAPSAPRRVPTWAAAVWATTGTRTEVVGELSVPVRGAYRGLVSVGIADTETFTANGASVAVDAVPLRVGVAWRGVPTGRLGALEARLGAVVLVETAAAERSATEAIAGAGAGVAWAVPIAAGHGRGLALVLGAGADAFVTARDYRVDGVKVATTPRVAWWAGLSIAAELWR
jgi:hypothetical protein